MADAPKRLCFVNCGLPADQCECYRDIMQERADLIDMDVLARVEAALEVSRACLSDEVAEDGGLEVCDFGLRTDFEMMDAALSDLRAMMEKLK